MNIEETKDFYLRRNNHREEQVVTMKRKRTKRHKPLLLLPYGLSAVTTSSSSGGGDDGGGDGDASLIGDETYESTTTTEEEEDMANCLILLARSGDGKELEKNKNIRNFDGGAGAGYYGYECKTCNRNFPTFQALGGHRASHKKPKIDTKSMFQLQHDDHQQQNRFNNKIKTDHNSTSNVTLSLLHGTCFNNKSSIKIHECSICGSAFSSGQALGGHMRRHRTLTTSSQIITTNHHQKHETDQNSRNVLSLDLNLPAPEDDDRSTPMFHVFSTPAMVDCHF